MTDQKGSAKVALLVVLVVVMAVVLVYFVFLKKPGGVAVSPTPTPVATKTATPTPDETANWKTYNNTRYAYTVKYPTNWFVDTTYSENDFTQRGPVEDNDFIGGDTTWSNYQNPGQYDLGTIPSDFTAVYLLIYKTDTQTTLDSFINLKRFSYSKKENVNINGVSGIRLITKNPENSSATSKIVLLKVGNKVFDFSYARNSAKSATVMDQMLQNFRLK